MGSKIELKNWKYFRGGLDVKSKHMVNFSPHLQSYGIEILDNTTGLLSYYTRFRTYEIMFHVNTLLPLVKSDPLKVFF